MTTPGVLEDLSWAEDVQDWIAAWAWSGIPFSADDLRLSFRAAPTPNQVGAAFQTARKAGLIEPIGYRESTTPSRRHSVIRTWRGVTEGVKS